MFKPRIAELQRQAGVKSRKETIGLGLKYKHKDELIAQALELYHYQEFDVYSPGGEIRRQKKDYFKYFQDIGYEKGYELPEEYDDWSLTDYERMQGRYEYGKSHGVGLFEPIEDFVYDDTQSEWHESLSEREHRTREEIGQDAYEFAKEADQKKFDKFVKNHPDIDVTYDEWEQMVIFAGGIGSTIAAELGSEQIVSLMDRRTRSGRMSLDITFQIAFDKIKASGEPVTGQAIIDEMANISAKWSELSDEPI